MYILLRGLLNIGPRKRWMTTQAKTITRRIFVLQYRFRRRGSLCCNTGVEGVCRHNLWSAWASTTYMCLDSPWFGTARPKCALCWGSILARSLLNIGPRNKWMMTQAKTITRRVFVLHYMYRCRRRGVKKQAPTTTTSGLSTNDSSRTRMCSKYSAFVRHSVTHVSRTWELRLKFCLCNKTAASNHSSKIVSLLSLNVAIHCIELFSSIFVYSTASMFFSIYMHTLHSRTPHAQRIEMH